MSSWLSVLPGGRRTALVAGLGVALGLGTLGLGARYRATRKPPAPSAHVATPERSASAPAHRTKVSLAAAM